MRRAGSIWPCQACRPSADRSIPCQAGATTRRSACTWWQTVGLQSTHCCTVSPVKTLFDRRSSARCEIWTRSGVRGPARPLPCSQTATTQPSAHTSPAQVCGPHGLLPSCQLAMLPVGSYRPALKPKRRVAASQQQMSAHGTSSVTPQWQSAFRCAQGAMLLYQHNVVEGCNALVKRTVFPTQ